MTRLWALLRSMEFQVAAFAVLLLLLCWPYMADSGFSSIMHEFVYMLVIWAVSIILTFFISIGFRKQIDSDDTKNRKR